MEEQNNSPRGEAFDELLRRAGLEGGGAETTDETAENGAETAAKKPARRKKKAAAATAGTEESEKRARETLRRLTDIDDESGQRLTLRGILGGDIFSSPSFRRQLWYILMLCVMAIVYVSNRYGCQREIIRGEELREQLIDRKFKALTIAAELTESTMRGNIEESLPDTTLHPSSESVYYLPVDAPAQ